MGTTSRGFGGLPARRETRSSALDRYVQALTSAGEERAEIRYVWEQAGRAVPGLAEFAARRVAELAGVGPASVVTDLQTLPDIALGQVAGHLRRVLAWQIGPGLAYMSLFVALLREEQGRRVRALVTPAELAGSAVP